MSEDRKRWQLPVAVIVAGLIVAAGWGATLGNWLYHIGPPKDATKAGQFGDTFGAVNALFSGLAMIGVAFAVYLQRQELREAREGAKKTEATMARQAEALLAAAKLNAAQSLVHMLKEADKELTDYEFLAGPYPYRYSKEKVLEVYIKMVIKSVETSIDDEYTRVKNGSMTVSYLLGCFKEFRIDMYYFKEANKLHEAVRRLRGGMFLLSALAEAQFVHDYQILTRSYIASHSLEKIHALGEQPLSEVQKAEVLNLLDEIELTVREWPRHQFDHSKVLSGPHWESPPIPPLAPADAPAG